MAGFEVTPPSVEYAALHLFMQNYLPENYFVYEAILVFFFSC